MMGRSCAAESETPEDKPRYHARPPSLAVVLLWGLLCQIGFVGCAPDDTGMRPERSAQVPADMNAGLLLQEVRRQLAAMEPVAGGDSRLTLLHRASRLPKRCYGLALVLYQPGEKRILVLRRGSSRADELLRDAVAHMRAHPRLSDFAVQDPSRARIQIDFLLFSVRTRPLLGLLAAGKGAPAWEPGIDGLRLSDGKEVRYLLPGDAFVRSILSKGQLRIYIKHMFPDQPLSRLRYTCMHSRSYVSSGASLLPLYRGYPIVGAVGPEHLAHVVAEAIRFVKQTQKPDGRFLYYYDAAQDSYRDHIHPTRDPEKNPYYNILRHAGGILLLLEDARHGQTDAHRDAIQRAVRFLVSHVRNYELPGGREAAYVFYNKKAKLGGSGLGLLALVEYQALTGDRTHEQTARLLKEHLLAQIRPSGEFFYYHICPGRDKHDKGLFCFYYPGEALMGLVSYAEHLAIREERRGMQEKMHKALHFLLEERPVLYRQHFTSLPSDAWLMMAINALWDMPAMRRQAYRDFVFRDADALVRQMYTARNAPYPDCVGSFFYKHGDHPYPDGARAEGLLAAYELARKVRDDERQARYLKALQAACWATMHLVNTPASTYAAKRPERAIGGIRFKLTRQWFRIDTIQHVAGFYSKLLPYWPRGETVYPYE